ncbi:diguanylate cyclase/phosphodiesterase (GGDEF & EAL domains) with PAS/PAC sensor(s) [hydrothermal vent metagenome]|uniref:Diguanylate cyclase/phosphodiesterase (GGDEF & EAL domains) with PAS/PAC sensor(S) n=1 Tax=hydrothermal vent metagenome TaxID=652676 RepID=A0A3B1B3J5_9ZZZZ
MNNLSIKTKVLLITIIPVLITACLLSFSFVKERLKDTERVLNEKGWTVSKYLAPALEYSLLSGNKNHIDSLIKNSLSISNVSSITVLDANQHIITHQSIDNTEYNTAHENHSNGTLFSTQIYRSEININDYDTNRIEADKEIIGVLVVEMSRKGINLAQKEIIRNGILITLSSILFTIILALYFSNTVVSPIRLLTRGIHQIRKGILGERIYTGAGGEIAILEIGINNMSASLQLAQIKEKQRADDTLFIEKSKAQITLEAIGDGVITTDTNGFITYLNPAAENLLGVGMTNTEGMHLHDIFRLKSISGNTSICYPVSTCLEEGKSMRHDDPMILIGASNTEYIIRDNATPLLSRDGKITGMVLVFNDFTHIQRISDQLTFQATHDELTGLKNRREFERTLKELIETSDFETQEHALCFLDLDRFKIVNDTCGHVAGDALLKEVSRLIHSQVRHDDLVARLGGDEFGIILVNCTIKQAVLIAENIKETIKQHQCKWDLHVFNVGVSIGLIPVSSTDCSSAELMINADTACYIAKDNGKNQVHVYQTTDHNFLHRHNEIRWLQKINKALDSDGFELYAQTIIPINNNSSLKKYEILIRLSDSEEIILPSDFLPAAEHYSLMPEIDRWVITTFVKMLEKNNFSNFKNNKHMFSVNLSGQSICSDDFHDFVISLLKTSAVNPGLIIFEITETVAIHNYDAAIKLITRLQKLGCAFALDDFGSGISSFRYLKELPINYLKIDGHFIRNIEVSKINQSIVEAITQIAQALKLETIAEYVETEESRRLLEKFGIDYVQGSVVNMPIPLADVFRNIDQ